MEVGAPKGIWQSNRQHNKKRKRTMKREKKKKKKSGDWLQFF